jgi:hypothetical protein
MRINRAESAGGTAWLVPSLARFVHRQVVLAAREQPSQPKVPYRIENAPSTITSQTVFEFISGEHIDVPSMQLDRGSRDGTDARWL